MNLFVPRKDLPPVPTDTKPELADFLKDLQTRQHTNELAVQRWANTGHLSVGVRQVGAAQAYPALGGFIQATYDTVDWDYYKFANTTAGTLTIPESGIYLISGGLNIQNIPGPGASAVDFQLLPGGQVTDTEHLPVGGYANLNLAATRRYTAKTAVSVQVSVQPAPGAGVIFKLWEFTATKVFDIPSAVQ